MQYLVGLSLQIWVMAEIQSTDTVFTRAAWEVYNKNIIFVYWLFPPFTPAAAPYARSENRYPAVNLGSFHQSLQKLHIVFKQQDICVFLSGCL